MPSEELPQLTRPTYTKTDLASLLAGAQAACSALLRDCEGDEVIALSRLLTPPLRDTVSEASASSRSPPTQFTYKDLLKIQAPMVRCSRPPFRHLCRLWGTDISYTHMIMADSFVRSAEARASDFALYEGESRLVTQFAAKDGPLLAQAAQIVAPYCDAVDINCGCPQKWAIAEGVGSGLLEHPETIADMVRCVFNMGGGRAMPCVVKIRVFDDVQRTVELARRAEAMGAAWVTVHGRTPTCTPGSPVRPSAIKLIKENLHVPVVANGGITDPASAARLAIESGGLGGVMCAQALLDNPACFYHAGFHPSPYRDAVFNHSLGRFVSRSGQDGPSSVYEGILNEPLFSSPVATGDKSSLVPAMSGVPTPPVEAVSDFVRLAVACNLPIKATQHHLSMMTHRLLTPTERLFLGEQGSILGSIQYLHDKGLLVRGGFFV